MLFKTLNFDKTNSYNFDNDGKLHFSTLSDLPEEFSIFSN